MSYEYIYESSDVLLVSKRFMEVDDGVFLLLREVAALDVRAEVVDPSKTTALPATQ